jgi:hypothetical protein
VSIHKEAKIGHKALKSKKNPNMAFEKADVKIYDKLRATNHHSTLIHRIKLQGMEFSSTGNF